MSESEQEKTEDATPERQKQAREEGRFPRAKDTGNTGASLFVLLVLVGMASRFGSVVESYTKQCFRDLSVLVRGESSLVLHGAAVTLATLVLPVVLAAAIGGSAAGFAEAGFHPNLELAAPKWERLSPLGKLQQMFSPGHALSTVGIQIARLVVVGAVAYNAIKASIPDLLKLAATSSTAASIEIVKAILGLSVRASIALVVLVLLEYGQSWMQHQKSMRMTKEEIKEEYKQQEGDPKIRARMRARARELAKRSVTQSVKEADFVIANPTHVSVAIRYRQEEGAPLVVAKGYDEIALHIRRLATESNVPIVENVPLARALAKRVKVGRQIPVDLYSAVAEVLAFVYRVKSRRFSA